MSKSVLLLGSYGQTNLGDDLLMYNLLDMLVKRGYERVIVNISKKELMPLEVMSHFGDKLELYETYETSPFLWLKLLRRVDAIVYGGGTIFKDLYASTGRGKHSVVMRIAVMNVIARILGKKVYHMFIGIGSIRTKTGKLLTKLSLNAATHTYFRDQESDTYARHVLNIANKKITLATDGIFLNTVWGERPRYTKLRGESARQAAIGVNALSDIPDWVDRESYIREMRLLLKSLTKQNALLVFIPFQTNFNPKSDLLFMQQELLEDLPRDSYVLCDNTSLSDLQPIFAQLDYFIGMRFHSLLISTVYHVPFLALEYDTKCTRLMKDMDYPYALALENMTAMAALHNLNELHSADRKELQKLQAAYVETQTRILDDALERLDL